MLSSLNQSKKTGEITEAKKPLVFNGTFLNFFQDSTQRQFVISIVREKNELHIIELNNLERIRERVLTLPFGSNENDYPFTFINEGETVSPASAESPNKIFRKGDDLYFCIDQNRQTSNSFKKTIIVKLNVVSGQKEREEIIDSENAPFRTYIEGNYIYKLSKGKVCIVNIYNLSDLKKVATFTLTKN